MSDVRTALVTGASRGIGLGIAQSLARHGYGLTISSRKQHELDRVAEDLRALGAREVGAVAADVGDQEAVLELVDCHRRVFGSMKALIVNAGTGTAGRVSDIALDRVRRTLDVNFTAALLLIQAATPLLRGFAEQAPQEGARIVALSSITGAYVEPGLGVYGASKAALTSLIEAVNAEESGAGIAATAIAPGYVDTDMARWVSDRVPVDTMIRVTDVARVVEMLLELGPTASIPAITMSRSGASPYGA